MEGCQKVSSLFFLVLYKVSFTYKLPPVHALLYGNHVCSTSIQLFQLLHLYPDTYLYIILTVYVDLWQSITILVTLNCYPNPEDCPKYTSILNLCNKLL